MSGPAVSAPTSTASPGAAAGPGRRRSVLVWIAIVIVVVIVGAVGGMLASNRTWSQRDPLDPESPGPNGTRALARILSEHGVDVRITRSHEEAERLLTSADATLATPDARYLSTPAMAGLLDRARDAGADIVLLSTSRRSLEHLFPGAGSARPGSGNPVAPACDLPAARAAGDVAVTTVIRPGDASADLCYPESGGAGVLTTMRGEARVSAIDANGLLTNDALAHSGNAALGIGLLGSHATLVWYAPSAADSDLAGSEPPTIASLTPAWVTPVVLLALFGAAAAALWRGRRFGPLVTERLPVTVRASETMRGRAHLYAESDDVAHAAMLLRRGTRDRLARLMGLRTDGLLAGADRRPAGSVSAHPGLAVADAVAALLGTPAETVRTVLAGPPPRDRGELLQLSDMLRDLENAVAAVRSADGGAPRHDPHTPTTGARDDG